MPGPVVWPRMRKLGSAAVLVVLFCAIAPSSSATADELRAAREQPLREISHQVRVSIKGGVATYRVRRTFHNPGNISEEARLTIRLPYGAVATGLRIKHKSSWRDGLLMPVDKAEELYQELSERGRGTPQTSALLHWRRNGELGLRLFPISPKSARTIEYTLTAPTEYVEGEYVISYPRANGDIDRATPTMRVVGDNVAKVRLEGKALGHGKRSTPLQLTESRLNPAEVHVALKENITRVRYGRVDVVQGKNFFRFEADIAPRLSEHPRGQSVVFVIDASHTMGEVGIEAQLRLIGAYLSHVPDASFQLVTYGRRAEQLTSHFVPAKRFVTLQKRLRQTNALTPRNGSFLDRAIEAADAVLSTRPGKKALVLLTDDRLRKSWAIEPALASLDNLDSGTIVHVVELHPEQGSDTKYASIERDDRHRLFPLARRRGGVTVTTRGVSSARGASLQEQVRYLVRPDRLDNWSWSGLLGLEPGTAQTMISGTLREGEALRVMHQVPRAPTMATLRGELWTRPVYFSATRSEVFDRATAGFVFSDNNFSELSTAEHFVIASYGRAVSPATSYVAAEPGVRPSNTEVPAMKTHSPKLFACGFDGADGGEDGKEKAISWRAVAQHLHAACAAHKEGRTRLGLELQDREIADIEQTGPPSPFAACVYEAAWNYTLPPRRGDSTHWLTVETVP